MLTDILLQDTTGLRCCRSWPDRTISVRLTHGGPRKFEPGQPEAYPCVWRHYEWLSHEFTDEAFKQYIAYSHRSQFELFSYTDGSFLANLRSSFRESQRIGLCFIASARALDEKLICAVICYRKRRWRHRLLPIAATNSTWMCDMHVCSIFVYYNYRSGRDALAVQVPHMGMREHRIWM